MINELSKKLISVYSDVNQARQIACWLLEKLLDITSVKLLTIKDLKLSSDQTSQLDAWLYEIIVQHKPVQYVLGNVPFLDLDILVEPPILIPRLETEWWVSLLLEQFTKFKDEPIRILDLCSGSGCIGLALAKFFKNSQVVLVDISEQSCQLINKNIRHNQIKNAQIVNGDLYEKLGDYKFDLIVANPPYIPKSDYEKLDLSVRLWEDRRALIAPHYDLEIIEKIIKFAPQFLEKKDLKINQLWLEIDNAQGQDVLLFAQNYFAEVKLFLDQFKRQRVVVAKL